jgi:hypothetical protein
MMMYNNVKKSSEDVPSMEGMPGNVRVFGK